MPFHSCTEPNLIQLDFGATLEQRLIQMAYLIREGHGKQFSMRIYASWIH